MNYPQNRRNQMDNLTKRLNELESKRGTFIGSNNIHRK